MDNRELIMNTAISLFSARGYDAVGVQEIVEQAGVTKPTLYYYFGSKQGLLQKIVDTNSVILEQMLSDAVTVPGDVPFALKRVARAYFDFANEHWQFYRFMVGQLHAGHETEGFRTVFPVISRCYQFLVKLFDDSADVLGNMNGRQAQFAISFMGTLDSHMVMFMLHPDEKEHAHVTDEKVHEIVRQFLYGIFT